MRKIVFCVLAGVLAALVAARALTPESARAASDAEQYGYNLCSISLPVTTETAGSALVAELNSYYLFRTPTAKNRWTGSCAGKSLVVILADAWRTPAQPGRGEAALRRLDRESAQLGPVYRTDWFQGAAGECFALLTGVVPTTVDGRSALAWTGERHTLLPYAPARMLAAEGYVCAAFVGDGGLCAGLRELGFGRVTASGGTAEETLAQTLPEVLEAERFFAFWHWSDEDCGAALEALLDGLDRARRLDDTVICLVTGADAEGRGHIRLCGGGLDGAVSRRPCSALDAAPTLLNLFGLDYDSRMLSGLDLFADNGEPGAVTAVTPVVILYGSAYSDWVTDAGSYCADGSVFRQTADCFCSSREVSDYVREVARQVYDRYIYTRRAMEMNYFKVVLGG